MRFVIVVVGSFWPLIRTLSSIAQPPFQPPCPFLPFPTLVKALQGFQRPKQTRKQQNQFNWWRPCAVFTKFLKWQPVPMGCLNTPRLFSLGGELTLIFFFFSLKKSPQNWTAFSSFRGEWTCSPRFRTAKSYFCNDVREGKWPMATASITKSKVKTQDGFCCLPKRPNQREAETTHSLFENVKGKSSQDRNKHKNSVKCEHFIFGLGDLVWI